MKPILIFSILGIFLTASVTPLLSHCQVPCGIYDDSHRIGDLNEDAQTIEKAMGEISKLSMETPINHNQIVRWVTTKETHAQKIQDTITDYFLTQKIKPAGDKDKSYFSKLRICHEILVYAMKSKQTLDLKHIAKLRSLFTELQKIMETK